MSAAAVYSLLIKKENAHEDPIYNGVWAHTNISGEPKGPITNFIITGGLDGLIKVWTLQNNKLEIFNTLKGHAMSVVSIAASPDGHTIASTSLDSTLIIWDLVSGNMVHKVKRDATDMWKVAFSPDGKQVVSGSHTGKVIIYGITEATVDRVLDTRGKFSICVDWSGDGKYICSGAVDGNVCIFDVAQAKLIHTMEAHTQTVRSVKFSRNSQMFVTASNDGYVKVYKSASANLLNKIKLKCWVLNACFSKDGKRIAAATADGSVYVLSADDLQILKHFQEHSQMAWDVKFIDSSNKLVSVSKDNSINIYEYPLPAKQSKK